jgi:light-regulated signal transduction histidine kinase (bacteriophytochrome)
VTDTGIQPATHAAATDDVVAELRRARAQIAALEQLLEVHEQASIEQATRLEQSNRDLDQFAYVASHDLKAPLRGIANLAQWLEEDLGDRVTGESREHLTLLRGRVNRMEALIEGILTYSRAGRVRDQVEYVDTAKLLASVIDLLAPPSDVTITIQSPMPSLLTERLPLQQVFMNLIGNALKYGNRVSPRVTVTAKETGDMVHFSVADNGPGIAPQFHEKIWQIFQTLAPRDEVEGTGIGLSVVRKLVETRGGRAWVESTVGQGTTFHFTWPTRPRSNT